MDRAAWLRRSPTNNFFAWTLRITESKMLISHHHKLGEGNHFVAKLKSDAIVTNTFCWPFL